jgi:hypothetical protein
LDSINGLPLCNFVSGIAGRADMNLSPGQAFLFGEPIRRETRW